MNQGENIRTLIQQGDYQALIAFLKTLNESERGKLKKVLQDMEVDLQNYPVRGNNNEEWLRQKTALGVAFFICGTRRQFDWMYDFYVLHKEILDYILPWYCPSWFNAYINSFSSRDYINPDMLNYAYLLELQEQGHVTPTPELIVALLPMGIFTIKSFQQKERIVHFRPENLEAKPITLDNHFWLLFQYPSDIYYTGRWDQQIDMDTQNWLSVIPQLAEKGRIDRKRLLIETLAGTTQNFNRNLTNWFADLFVALKATPAEVIELQENLIATFYSAQSKPIKIALKHLQQIAHHSNFQLDNLLDQSFTLFSSETKSVVTGAFSLFNQIAKKQPAHKEALCMAATQALMQTDISLQTKAAKFIAKYSTPDSLELSEQIAIFEPGLSHESKSILANFLLPHSSPEAEEILENTPEDLPSRIRQETLIPEIATTEDLVFLASQAFDNHEVYHVDIMLNALVQFQDQWNEEVFTKISPAIQRAYRIMYQGGNSQTGLIDHMLAVFFIEYFAILEQRGHDIPDFIKKSYKNAIAEEKEASAEYKFANTSLLDGMTNWANRDDRAFYAIFKKWLIEVQEKIKKHNKLPLLSTPTHAPHWVAPIKLVERMLQYQESGEAWGEIDFQIALSRLALEDTEDALKIAHQSFDDETWRLLHFTLSPEQRPTAPFTQPAVWWTAAMTKDFQGTYEELKPFLPLNASRNTLDGQYEWAVEEEVKFHNRYDYEKKKNIRESYIDKSLKLQEPPTEKKGVNFLKGITRMFSDQIKSPPFFLYTATPLRTGKMTWFISENDLHRTLALFPNNPDPIYARILFSYFTYSDLWESTEGKLNKKALAWALEQHAPFGNMTYLLVAASMLRNDKTIRAMAGEVWIQAVNQGRMDSKRLGLALGQLESQEYGPLKRLTDLISQQMSGISPVHDQELEKLLGSCLLLLPEAPLRNTKKVLEIYHELLQINRSKKLDQTIVQKLQSWKEISSLKRIVGRLLQLKKS